MHFLKISKLLMIPLSAQMLISCASSTAYVDKSGLNIPNLPSSVTKNGNVIKIPKGPLNKQQVDELLIKLRESEVINARAVRTAKAHYANLQRIYKRKVSRRALGRPPGLFDKGGLFGPL